MRDISFDGGVLKNIVGWGAPPMPPPPLWETLLFIYTIYTISISFICVSQEEPILTASNQRMYEFYKS